MGLSERSGSTSPYLTLSMGPGLVPASPDLARTPWPASMDPRYSPPVSSPALATSLVRSDTVTSCSNARPNNPVYNTDVATTPEHHINNTANSTREAADPPGSSNR